MGTKIREFGRRQRRSEEAAAEHEQSKARQVANGMVDVSAMRVDGVIWGWLAAFDLFIRMRNDAVPKDRVVAALPGHVRFIRSMLAVKGTPASVERGDKTTIGGTEVDGVMLAMLEREWGRLRWTSNAVWLIGRNTSDLAVAFWKKGAPKA